MLIPGQIEIFLLIWDRLKKIASIFLLGILLFNWFGYRLLIGYWQEKTTRELEARLDGDSYDESQLISIKVPVTHLAYYNSSPVFERVSGGVEIGGVQYRYVKRRLYNDSLEFLCIPDAEAGRLRSARNEIVRLAADQSNLPDGDSHGKPSPTGKGSLQLLNAFYHPSAAFTICNFPARNMTLITAQTPPL